MLILDLEVLFPIKCTVPIGCHSYISLFSQIERPQTQFYLKNIVYSQKKTEFYVLSFGVFKINNSKFLTFDIRVL